MQNIVTGEVIENTDTSQISNGVSDNQIYAKVGKDFIYIISDNHKDRSIIQKGLVDRGDKW